MSVEKWPFWLKIGRVGRVRDVPVRHGIAVSCNFVLERQQALFDYHNPVIIPITLLCPPQIMYMLEHTPYASRQALAVLQAVIQLSIILFIN